jgi:hypothetical protein
MDLGQRATSVKFVIRDRAGQFTSSFDAVFAAEGIRILASPPQAPRANAVCERIIGTLRRELLDQLLIVNEQHLRRVLTEYLLHYNDARPHRSLGQLTPAQADTRPPEPQINLAEHRINQKQILGGLARKYYVAALPLHVATGNARSPSESYFRAPQDAAGHRDRDPDAQPSGHPRLDAVIGLRFRHLRRSCQLRDNGHRGSDEASRCPDAAGADAGASA